MPLLGKSGEVMECTKVRVIGGQDQGKERHSSLMVIYAILSRGNLCHKFTLFCREANYHKLCIQNIQCKFFREPLLKYLY